MRKLLVSVIVPTYNRKNKVSSLIDSILKSSYKRIEILVVDDASTDKTTEYLRKRYGSKIRLLNNKKNFFAAYSKNIGQINANGDFLLFIDDDNIIDKDAITILVDVLVQNPQVGMVGPVNYEYRRKWKVLLSGTYRNMWTTKTRHLRSLNKLDRSEIWEATDIPNAFMVRARVVRDMSIMFRSKYGIMYEESDYAYRIKRAGYKIVFCKKAKIYHDVESSVDDYHVAHFIEDPRRAYLFARNRILFHAIYSSKIQLIVILAIWIWVFLFAYCVEFLKYRDKGVRFNNNLLAVKNYCFGTLEGLILVASNRALIFLKDEFSK